MQDYITDDMLTQAELDAIYRESQPSVNPELIDEAYEKGLEESGVFGKGRT